MKPRSKFLAAENLNPEIDSDNKYLLLLFISGKNSRTRNFVFGKRILLIGIYFMDLALLNI
jgi:hypothetical protein